ncbi:hypothetical protein EVAR_97876_1 [Eumeta japonica]|uniref:Uncharacterized protein n=1 Tax=Eumeta variegata TaxID=151549 RepID=A0A4C1WFH2_EUMVA|nr:hypothetical protein EVAR_97876_1 [Eumeta japonica]
MNGGILKLEKLTVKRRKHDLLFAKANYRVQRKDNLKDKLKDAESTYKNAKMRRRKKAMAGDSQIISGQPKTVLECGEKGICNFKTSCINVIRDDDAYLLNE